MAIPLLYIHAPQSPEILLALKEVSDEWLKSFSIKEHIFSQGMFD